MLTKDYAAITIPVYPSFIILWACVHLLNLINQRKWLNKCRDVGLAVCCIWL